MSNDIDSLRAELFDTIRQLKSGKLDVATAKAVADVSGRIIETAKVEVHYAEVTGQRASGAFLPPETPRPANPVARLKAR